MHFPQELSFLLLPWILSFFVSVIYECLVFVYLITNKKVSHSKLTLTDAFLSLSLTI